MKKKKVAFLGAKKIGYLCFKDLITHHQDDECEIVGVITRETNLDAGESITSLCNHQNIPLLRDLKALLDLKELDILISVQHDQILKREHIDKASDVAVNLHLAPLPEYRGCNQFSFAIIDRANSFGATLHKIDEGIDNGDILFEKRFQINPDQIWVDELYQKTVDAGSELFTDHINDLLAGNYVAVPQEKFVKSRGTSIHYRKEIMDIKQIDLSWDAGKIDTHIRATSMPGFDPPYTFIGNQKVYFRKASN